MTGLAGSGTVQHVEVWTYTLFPGFLAKEEVALMSEQAKLSICTRRG